MVTKRQAECLEWVAQGKTAKEIAIILGISFHTVRDYLKTARERLDCTRTVQAAMRREQWQTMAPWKPNLRNDF